MSAIHISRDLGSQQGKLIQRGIVVLVLAVLAGGFLLAMSRGVFSSDVRFKAQLDNVGGALAKGNDVKVRGAIIGTVQSIEASGDNVLVEFTMREDEAKRLPAGVTARILPATVFGTSFLDIVPPERPSGQFHAASQVIAQDTSVETKELQDTLDKVTTILTAIEPAKVASTLGAYAQALDGRGEEIGDTLETLDAYLARLEPEIPLLREDLRLLATNLDTVRAVTPQLLNATDNVLTTARTVVAKRAQINKLITGGTAFVKETDKVLVDIKDDAIRALDGSAVIIDAMYDERDGFAATFRSFVTTAERGAAAFGGNNGPMGDVLGDLTLSASTAGDEYTGGGVGGASTQSRVSSAPVNADIVNQIRGILSSLEEAGAGDGVGSLIAQPYLGEESGQ